MSGIARIKRAYALQAAVFSSGSLVPQNNIYYSDYKEENLKLLNTRKKLYKTTPVSESDEHFVNYALRAYLKYMLHLSASSEDFNVSLITVRFSDELSSKLSEADLARTKDKRKQSPLQSIASRFRKKIFPECGIEYDFFVLEKSDDGSVHAHVVALMNIDNKLKLNSLLRKRNWLSKDRTGKTAASAVNIAFDYWRYVYRKKTVVEVIRKGRKVKEEQYDPSDDIANTMELEIETVSNSKWMKYGHERLPSGKVMCVKFKRKDKSPIDTGLADYLAKELSYPFFNSCIRNFSVSNSLAQQAASFINEQIEKNKTLR